MFSQLFDGALLESIVRALIPVLLAAIGGMLCERAGVFQISLEGMMLVGAFAAVAGSYAGESALLGVVIAMASGALLSLVLAYGAVSRRGDPIVIGVAVNLLALGLTGFLLPQLFAAGSPLRGRRPDKFAIPGLRPTRSGRRFQSVAPGYPRC